MVDVWNSFVLASFVRAVASRFGTDRRILIAYFQNAFIKVRVVNGMQMTVVQKIVVISVTDLFMSATRAVNVRMIFVN
jgi:hypothetical protein